MCFCHTKYYFDLAVFFFLCRFVVEGHIPYLNVYQDFPEKMKLYGLDLKIFCVEVIFSLKF